MRLLNTRPGGINNLYSGPYPDIDIDASVLSKMFQLSTFATAVAANNDPVGGILPKRSHLNPIQATAGARPLYKSSHYNSQPMIVADGIDDYLRATGASVLNQPLTVMVAFKLTSVAVSTKIFDCGGTASERCQFLVNSSGNWAISGDTQVNSVVPADTDPHVATIVFDDVRTRLYIDGEMICCGDGGQNPISGLTLFASRGTATGFSACGIRRLLMWGGLDITTDSTYCHSMQRALEAQLGITHPTFPTKYRNAVKDIFSISTRTMYDAWTGGALSTHFAFRGNEYLQSDQVATGVKGFSTNNATRLCVEFNTDADVIDIPIFNKYDINIGLWVDGVRVFEPCLFFTEGGVGGDGFKYTLHLDLGARKSRHIRLGLRGHFLGVAVPTWAYVSAPTLPTWTVFNPGDSQDLGTGAASNTVDDMGGSQPGNLWYSYASTMAFDLGVHAYTMARGGTGHYEPNGGTGFDGNFLDRTTYCLANFPRTYDEAWIHGSLNDKDADLALVQANMEAVIALMKANNPDIMLFGWSGVSYEPRASLAQNIIDLDAAYKEVCDDYGIPYLSMYDFIETAADVTAYIHASEVHMNLDGHYARGLRLATWRRQFVCPWL